MATKTGYSLLREIEDKDIDSCSSVKRNICSPVCTRFLICIYVVVLHVVLAACLLDQARQCSFQVLSHILPAELSTSVQAVEYDTVILDPSGFSKEPKPPNKWEGPPSDENNQAWHDLINVGMFVLTEEEYRTMDFETAELVDRPGERLVTIEVFHQLHCLDYLRLASWAAELGEMDHHPGESDWSKRHHINHCVDYLRQILMCHGDLTPITLERVDEQPPYLPNFSIKHTCRNFDRIYEFAESRNTSEYGIA